MKLTIERNALLRALVHAGAVVERRNTIPILSNVLLEADNGVLRLTTTDLNIQMVEEAVADVETPGKTTVAADTLLDIVRKLNDDWQITLQLVDNQGKLLVRAGRSRFNLVTLPPDDFPVIANEALPHQFTMPAAELEALINKTRFAMSTEETRYYLNGIFMHEDKDGKLRAVATDGHRLSKALHEKPDHASSLPDVIIPRKTINEVVKLLADLKGNVTVSLSPAKIRFEGGTFNILSKVVDGTFPNYERVIPSGNTSQVTFSPKLLSQTLDRVTAVASDKIRAVKLSIEHERIEVSVRNPDMGTAVDEISAQASEALEIGFNARYLSDILAQYDEDEIEMTFSDAGSPVIIRKIGDDNDLQVLMPLRI